MNFIYYLLEAGNSPTNESVPGWMNILQFSPLILLGVVFYFFLYRPQKKKEKEIKEMRNSVEKGDVISTSGGIVGIVVKVKDDMILIESGADRTKLQIQKWAVHSVLSKAGEPE